MKSLLKDIQIGKDVLLASSAEESVGEDCWPLGNTVEP